MSYTKGDIVKIVDSEPNHRPSLAVLRRHYAIYLKPHSVKDMSVLYSLNENSQIRGRVRNWRFKPVDPKEILEWQLSRSEAERIVNENPNSYWVRYALENHESKTEPIDFPETPFISGDLFDKLPAGTRLYFKNSTYEGLYTLSDERSGSYRHVYNSTFTNYSLAKGISNCSSMAGNSIVLSLPTDAKPLVDPNEQIIVRIPVEDARRIGGCQLKPLVDAWDEQHKPKPKYWAKGNKVWTREQFDSLPIGTQLQWYGLAPNDQICMVTGPGEAFWVNERHRGQKKNLYDNTQSRKPDTRYWFILTLPEGTHIKP